MKLNLGAALLFVFSVPALAQDSRQTASPVKLTAGQSVYVVALDTSRRTDLSSVNLEVERDAKRQFAKEKKFTIASTLKSVRLIELARQDVYDKALLVSGDSDLACIIHDDYAKRGVLGGRAELQPGASTRDRNTLCS